MLGRTKFRQAGERAGAATRRGMGEQALEADVTSPRGLPPAGWPGRTAWRREAGTRAGRGLEGSAGSRDVTNGACRM